LAAEPSDEGFEVLWSRCDGGHWTADG
jgi:hypothetical protein